MDNDYKRPRPGFISDAEDMLHDFDEIDRVNDGVLTPGKIDSIKRYVDFGGEFATPEFLAKNFRVSLEDVQRVSKQV